MANRLKDIKIAILATTGFEQSELEVPKKTLEDEGAKLQIISIKAGKIKGWKHDDWGSDVNVDKVLEEADPNEYNLLILPGGVLNPDKLRLESKAIDFIKSFVKDNKPIAAICHGSWTLIDAQGVKGKTMTSWPSIKNDLINAGAHWVDKEVVRDGNLITSRNPGDLKAFTSEIIEFLSN
jgi:protease I